MVEPGTRRRARRRVTETGDYEPVVPALGPVAVLVGVLAVLVAMVAVSVGVVHVAALSSRRVPVPQIQVPQLVGRSAQAGADQLLRRGFVVDLSPEANILVSPGTVVGQVPVAGSKLEQGSRVVLRVSSGPPGITVPDVAGLPGPEAVRSATNSRLVGQVVEVFSDTVRPGEVVSTVPRAGRPTLPGTVVTINVSKGPRPRVVPEMVGREIAAAMADLARAGLGAGRVTVRATNASPPGVVLSTNPAAGSGRPPGFPVAVVVSGPVEDAVVPGFVGLTVDGAKQVAAAGRVTIRVRFLQVRAGDVAAGRIVSQSSPAGSVVPSGTVVDVVLAVDPLAPAGP
ncbi:MAG: PASTA domain-containing protein [Actinomycetes bacterium]